MRGSRTNSFESSSLSFSFPSSGVFSQHPFWWQRGFHEHRLLPGVDCAREPKPFQRLLHWGKPLKRLIRLAIGYHRAEARW